MKPSNIISAAKQSKPLANISEHSKKKNENRGQTNKQQMGRYLLSSCPLLCRAGSGESSSATEQAQEHHELVHQVINRVIYVWNSVCMQYSTRNSVIMNIFKISIQSQHPTLYQKIKIEISFNNRVALEKLMNSGIMQRSCTTFCSLLFGIRCAHGTVLGKVILLIGISSPFFQKKVKGQKSVTEKKRAV